MEHRGGVGRRLLMAFFGVSAFTALTGGIAIYVFLGAGRTLGVLGEQLGEEVVHGPPIDGFVEVGRDSGEGTEEGPPPRTYELREVIRQISETADGDTRLWIHHETVPDFVGLDGKVEPMKAMIMPFTVSDTLDVSDLAPATKIAFELTVDWSAAEPGLITAIEILPEGTVLAFESRR